MLRYAQHDKSGWGRAVQEPEGRDRNCYHRKRMGNPEGKDGMTPAELVRTEAAALEALAVRLDGAMAEDFGRAVDLIVRCSEGRGRVVVTGMGKSGIIAQKI